MQNVGKDKKNNGITAPYILFSSIYPQSTNRLCVYLAQKTTHTPSL